MMQVFKLYANVIPVKGIVRSTLCDLQRGRIKLIPNDLYDLLIEHRNKPIADILVAFDSEDGPIIEEYFAFLVRDDWGFYCDHPGSFPDLDLTYAQPAEITNAIIDVDIESNHDYEKMFQQLDELGCWFVQVRSYSRLQLPQMERILDATRDKRLKSIEIYVRYSPQMDEASLRTLFSDHPRIYRLIVHDAPMDQHFHCGTNKSMGELIYQKNRFEGPESCGVIDKGYFISELGMFTESLMFNNCLNKKISIDRKGFIRNCPSMNTRFGHFDTVDLAQVAADRAFRQIWNINKDQVEVCCDCEFRYVCSDCRAYTRDQNLYGKPSKCGYDPTTATWRETPMTVMVV